MTLPETYLVIKAHGDLQRQNAERELSVAWLTAALTRSKRLPKLKTLIIQSRPARVLRGKELALRRSEFNDLTAKWTATNDNQ